MEAIVSLGYSGPLCAVCEPHHALLHQRCASCPRLWLSILAWALQVLIYLVAFALLSRIGSKDAWTHGYAILKSLISFVQVITLPVSYPLPSLLQPVVTHALFYLSLANFDFLNALSIDCLAGEHVNYYVTTTFRAMIPMLVIAVLLVVYYVVPRIRHGREQLRMPSMHIWSVSTRWSSVSSVSVRGVSCYRSVTRQCAQFFFCERVGDNKVMVSGGGFTVRCFTPLWYWFTAPITLWLALYGSGIPVAVFVLLYRYRHQLDLRFIHSSYRDELYWWDCTEYARKLLLLLLSVNWWWLASVTDSPLATLSLAVSFGALSVHLSVLPFRSSQDHWFQTREAVWSAFVLSVVIGLYTPLTPMCWHGARLCLHRCFAC